MSTAKVGGESPEKQVDLRFRIGYRKQELPLVLPYSVRSIEDFIAAEDFPKPVPVRENGHLVFDRRDVEAWWAAKKAAGRQ